MTPLRVRSNTQIVTGQSLGATYTGSAINTTDVEGFAMQFIWSAGATPVGTLTLEASLDGTNFSTVPSSSQAVSGNSGNFVYDITGFHFPYVRLVYTRTSGTATAAIWYCDRVRQ